MASFQNVGESLELAVPARGTTISLAISGTYDQIILFQVEQGAPNSGAWDTITTYNTENQTEADVYTTKSWNETVRFFLDTDDGGDAAVTLVDNDVKAVNGDVVDSVGNKIVTFDEDGMTVVGTTDFQDSVTGPGIVNVTGSTLAVTAALHAGRIVTLNRAAGVACTLPLASGSGNVYTFFVGTTNTSVGNVVKATSAADSFGGGITLASDIAGVVIPTDADTDTITMGGSDTTQGGVLGTWVKLTDVAVGKYMCEGFLVSVGAESTPFGNGVS